MINLAGVPTIEADEQIRKELSDCGITILIPVIPSGEVKSSYCGALFYQRCLIFFRRSWSYWIVESTYALPERYAIPFNDKWGKHARWDGLGYGIHSNSMLSDYQNSFIKRGFWHVDTQKSLQALVALFTQLGSEIWKGEETAPLRSASIMISVCEAKKIPIDEKRLTIDK